MEVRPDGEKQDLLAVRIFVNKLRRWNKERKERKYFIKRALSNILWAAYHATDILLSIIVMLLLFAEESSSSSMLRHCFQVIKRVHHVNPD